MNGFEPTPEWDPHWNERRGRETPPASEMLVLARQARDADGAARRASLEAAQSRLLARQRERDETRRRNQDILARSARMFDRYGRQIYDFWGNPIEAVPAVIVPDLAGRTDYTTTLQLICREVGIDVVGEGMPF